MACAADEISARGEGAAARGGVAARRNPEARALHHRAARPLRRRGAARRNTGHVLNTRMCEYPYIETLYILRLNEFSCTPVLSMFFVGFSPD